MDLRTALLFFACCWDIPIDQIGPCVEYFHLTSLSSLLKKVSRMQKSFSSRKKGDQFDLID